MTPLNADAAHALLRDALHDRIVGAVVGSALGDAIGLYTEFLSAAKAAEAYPSGTFTLAAPAPTPFKLDTHRAAKEPGHWTDDTDHALLLLLSFLHTAKTAPPSASSSFVSSPDAHTPPPLPTTLDFAARLRVWVSQGLRALDTMPLGLGRLVSTVVASKGFDKEPARVAREYWVRTGRRIAPNGSIMRTHPLGLMCVTGRSEGEACALAAEMSRATHADPRCVVACVLATALVRAVVRGEVRSEAELDACLSRGTDWFLGQPTEELDLAELQRHISAAATLDSLQLDDPPAIGYVYKTLGSGVVLLRLAIRQNAASQDALQSRVKMFEALVTDLIMRGGDADTNACFAGALLGAYLGYKALPDHWKHGLLHGDWLLGKAEALSQVLGLKDGQYDGQQDKDTHHEMEGRWMVLQQTAFKKVEDASKAASTNVSKAGAPEKPAGTAWPNLTRA
ncbi:ADP-ribosylglycohydrolase-domain-containing protein [Lasiosphaeria miniovina]|uniref:ADP-ribosylglycohydrolase-domain-containing protein n=1 Tax=Lasiosphaeria miniovina TaxID=1954250 RepID=A0AA40ACP4_9PEZI|nr:ADP-ribosylglycohydrolase-domain-containing protein [Lasiosphaeria miniovina]KAK0713476.1 ADP-ribosylglycohydrolase-domain-containing protein [Lasiosphaeria miniovina]